VRQSVTYDFDGFITAMANYYGRYPRGANMADALLEWLMGQQDVEGFDTADWLKEMAEFGPRWNQLRNITGRGFTNAKVLYPLLPIWPLEWREWTPLALHYQLAYARSEMTADKLEAKLNTLQRRCMALTLVDAGSHKRRQTFRDALDEVRDGLDPFRGALLISQAARRRIRTTLRSPVSDHKMRRIILKWLEALGSEKSVEHLSKPRASDGSIDDVEVEHIMPANVKDGSDWMKKVPSFDDRVRLRDLLGNLILIPESLNREVGDLNFAQKKKILKKNAKRLAPYRLATTLLAYKDWNASTIEARTTEMGQTIWDKLELPNDPTFILPDMEPETDEEREIEPELSDGVQAPPDA